MSTTNLTNQNRFFLKSLNPLFRPSPAPSTEAETAPTPPDLITLADLEPQPIDWIWPQRLAAGTLALLSGYPGAGKTWLALAVAAHLSRGRAPYTGDSLPPSTTLYVSTEHDGAQIIHPRFAALDGDPARLLVLRATPPPPARPTPAQQAEIFNQLDAALDKLQDSNPVRLVILDPLDSLFSADPGSLPPDAFDQLQRLAEHHHCCILLLRHLRRTGPGRPSRQLCDFSHALRTEFLAGATLDAPEQPVLLHTKSNLAPLTPAIAYSITADGFRFTGLSQLTPQELLAPRPTGAGLPLRKFAGNWLRQQLAGGSQKQYALESNALRDGIALATLKRARFDLGVISTKDGTSGSWFWTLPLTEGQTQNN